MRKEKESAPNTLREELESHHLVEVEKLRKAFTQAFKDLELAHAKVIYSKSKVERLIINLEAFLVLCGDYDATYDLQKLTQSKQIKAARRLTKEEAVDAIPL
ncbi:hypothetical protein ACH5RR_025700 [Cinchona calisaya]|uniref:Uncharacterized protein n=1 Tax=Cinchona calisaya TaxID=153742 RepID=A0ABD2Z0E0_9GENT